METFGIHLHTLDIRQHARIHARAVAELGAGRVSGVAGRVMLAELPSPETNELLDTLCMVAKLKRRYPPKAIRSYVISGAESVEDVTSLIWLMELCGVRVAASPQEKEPGVMPVPLFESIDALRRRMIAEEYRRTLRSVLKALGQTRLLENTPPWRNHCGSETLTSIP